MNDCEHKETETISTVSGEGYQIGVTLIRCKKCKQVIYNECYTNIRVIGGHTVLVDLREECNE